jgi:putative transposase
MCITVLPIFASKRRPLGGGVPRCEHIDALRIAFRATRRQHPFTVETMVVLPDHLHTVWTLPAGDADFAKRWRLMPSCSSRETVDKPRS